MKPPYRLTPAIISLIRSVSEKIGEVNAQYLNRVSPQLRKQNRIKTIQSSLNIEGNTLSDSQVTDIMDNKRVIGPKKDIREVMNAIRVYDAIKKYDPYSISSFLAAHRGLLHQLVSEPGKFRSQNVGIAKGKKIAHVAPPAQNVPALMKNLFTYIKKDHDQLLIKSCVFHYETEFIHPFTDGNGRMGRLWQTVLLLQEYPVFEFLPFETLISKTQKKYYKALSDSDKAGHSTPFIEYMLNVIDRSLGELLKFNNRTLTSEERLQYFMETGPKEFTRKDYMNLFKNISTATASRDLKKAVDLKWIKIKGTKNVARYLVKLLENKKSNS